MPQKGDAKRGKHKRTDEAKQLPSEYVKLYNESVNHVLKSFFRGFKDATKSKIKKEDREETYQWIKRTLTEENLNEDTKKQKFPLGKDDTGNTVASLWRRDSPSFMQGFLKVLLGFALQVYLFTWARIGAFIPAAKHRKERGLRYMSKNELFQDKVAG
ncbi:hypothetical protein EYZ11_000356 [Aspergillus tanneri]|uniref:Uncharacterized protein n=1 Tax=Aspergillus tanneri TaxID=1220188 RepID=A0A4S3JXB2_9EURO|nr:hypothetical protein EYZ11_000356 [Aspergillus tanneri]